MKTLSMFLAETGAATERMDSRDCAPVVRVYSDHPDLWHLLNFSVSSVTSGPAAVLVAKAAPWYAARVFGQYGQEQWCICQNGLCRYLRKDGAWGQPMEGACFASQLDAERFACENMTL